MKTLPSVHTRKPPLLLLPREDAACARMRRCEGPDKTFKRLNSLSSIPPGSRCGKVVHPFGLAQIHPRSDGDRRASGAGARGRAAAATPAHQCRRPLCSASTVAVDTMSQSTTP